MTRILKAKVGTFTDREGNEKGKWIDVGVLMNGGSGEFLIMNRHVDLAGIGACQDLMSGQPREGVMVSIFDRDEQRQPAPKAQPHGGADTFDDDIPF